MMTGCFQILLIHQPLSACTIKYIPYNGIKASTATLLARLFTDTFYDGDLWKWPYSTNYTKYTAKFKLNTENCTNLKSSKIFKAVI